ncbi:MAG: CBS domain-containing protein [Gammaproteobacteria bacterium]|nr:CBS domain-containing protein [Gammaproteobacteria bacterium]MDH3859093.1 CBS domain-containing protein [Gammaproteobacteria bacterium]
MRVGEYCNREVVVVEEEKSVTEAAAIMRQYHVGDVVICKAKYGKQMPVGIITDRDIALEIVAKGTDPDSIRVGDAMSFDLITVTEHDDLMHVIELMRDKGIRRVPVIDADEALVGILTVDDIVDLLSEVLVDLAHLVDRQKRRETRLRP